MSIIYNPTDFHRNRVIKILSMYNNRNEILNIKDPAESGSIESGEIVEKSEDVLANDVIVGVEGESLEKSEDSVIDERSLQDAYDILSKPILG